MDFCDSGPEALPLRVPPARSNPSSRLLDKLQREAFEFFVQEYNPRNGLICDSSGKNSPSSIAVTGMGLTSYIVGVERGFMKKAEALRRSLAAVRFFLASEQSEHPAATGQRGFYYHFIDMKSGRRAWNCELSTIDTGLLLYGLLSVAVYFSGSHAAERELRERVEEIFARVQWRWACQDELTITHGCRPPRRFLKNRWQGYSEGLLLYVLAAGAPENPLGAKNYRAFTQTYQWKRIYGLEYLYAGPLFIHQFLHLWLDLKNRPDPYMRAKGIDYFENSRRATLAQCEYARRNPRGFVNYSETNWGLTASDGPGPAVRMLQGRRRRFFGYRARGIPYGPDDGTLSPWAAITSLPFAPEVVLPTIKHFLQHDIDKYAHYGFAASFNPSFKNNHPARRWESPVSFGLNQAPLLIMVENYRTGLIWKLMRSSQPIATGLQRIGFSGTRLT